MSYIVRLKLNKSDNMANTGALVINEPVFYNYDKACGEIARSILESQIVSKKELLILTRKISEKYHLDRIPKYSDILNYLPASEELRKILLKKPCKSASGVLVVAIMAKPYNCPHGRCIYCPGGVEFDVPLSYTGKEPITRKARKLDYDPRAQITSKINHYFSRGHDISKVELVIVGGTFPFMPINYQQEFAKSCYDALNGVEVESSSLEEAKTLNEKSKIRCVGFTVETKPDYCKRQHIDIMLELGITRVEIGVQTLDNAVYRNVNRGHNLHDVFEAFQTAKESGHKIVAHMMPGLPGSSPEKDLQYFKMLFNDQKLRPDMLKVYPTLVLKDTGLYSLYQKGQFSSYSDEEFVNLLVEIKKIIPRWVRIMRVQREIESPDIVAGPKLGNLRQVVQKKMREAGIECNCIRCREVGIRRSKKLNTDPVLLRSDYESSEGTESFLSLEEMETSILYAFLRLRRLKDPHRTELRTLSGEPGAIVRELHVYGQVTDIGKKTGVGSFQHLGYGVKLLKAAEEIVKEEFGLDKLSIISAVGTREYYRKFGYQINGPYMCKIL